MDNSLANLGALMVWLEFREKPPQELLKFKGVITHEFKSVVTQLDFVKGLIGNVQFRFIPL